MNLQTVEPLNIFRQDQFHAALKRWSSEEEAVRKVRNISPNDYRQCREDCLRVFLTTIQPAGNA